MYELRHQEKETYFSLVNRLSQFELFRYIFFFSVYTDRQTVLLAKPITYSIHKQWQRKLRLSKLSQPASQLAGQPVWAAYGAKSKALSKL